MFNLLWSREARFKERQAYRDALKTAKKEIEGARESHRAINEAWSRWWGSFQALQAYCKHLERVVAELQDQKRFY